MIQETFEKKMFTLKYVLYAQWCFFFNLVFILCLIQLKIKSVKLRNWFWRHSLVFCQFFVKRNSVNILSFNKIESIEIICFLNKNWTKHQGASYNRNFLSFFLTQVTQLLKEKFTSTNYLNITPPFTHYCIFLIQKIEF